MAGTLPAAIYLSYRLLLLVVLDIEEFYLLVSLDCENLAITCLHIF